MFVCNQNQNWESKLIQSNPTMRQDRYAVINTVNHWFRRSDRKSYNILPECVETICTEFYVLAKCGNCGQPATNDGNKQLYLNLFDGFIGCSRHCNKCSLNHWEEKYNGDKVMETSSLVVCLSSIDQHGIDVWSYAHNDWVHNNDTSSGKYLSRWGIKMNEYEWKTSTQNNLIQKETKKIVLLLKCSAPDDRYLQFQVKTTCVWSKIFRAYADNQNRTVTSFRFCYNGKTPSKYQTVAEVINTEDVVNEQEVQVEVLYDKLEGG